MQSKKNAYTDLELKKEKKQNHSQHRQFPLILHSFDEPDRKSVCLLDLLMSVCCQVGRR